LFEKGRSLLIDVIWCGARANFCFDALKRPLSPLLCWPAKQDGRPLWVYSQNFTTIVRVCLVTVKVPVIHLIIIARKQGTDCRLRAVVMLLIVFNVFSRICYQINLRWVELSGASIAAPRNYPQSPCCWYWN
jgi:hypothetical protein